MDKDNSGNLDPNEFWQAIRDYRLDIEDRRIELLFKAFDRNDDGHIDFHEFIRVLTGTMSDKRQKWIALAFRKLDKNQNGVIDIEEIKSHFNPTRHPDVKNGSKSEDEVFTEFIDLFDAHHGVENKFQPSRSVTWEEFAEFYNTISATIQDDKRFELLVTQVWNIDLKEEHQLSAGVHHTHDFSGARAAYKYDMHRSTFGDLDNSPYKHQTTDPKSKARA